MPSNEQQGLELKALGRVVDDLLSEIPKSKSDRIKANISSRVQKLYGDHQDAEQLAHDAPSELFSMTLDVLKENLDILSKEARGIAEVILEIRHDLSLQEEPQADLPIDAFGKRIGGIVRELESEGVLFDEADYPSNLPEESKIPLKFELFESLAQEAGISIEQFMDNPENRTFAAQALGEVLGWKKPASHFYAQLSPGNRKSKNGMSQWKKYLHKKSKA